MKFIHISDVHLGAGKDVLREIGINRYDEIWQTFRKSIETAIRMQPDLVLITGDLFHREPLLKELREVNYILSGLRDSKVVIVAGNHDYISDSSYYRTFKWSDNIDMITNDKITCIRYDDIKTTVYGMSYHTREIRENIFDNIVPDNEEINILIAHGGDEKHIPMDYKKILSNGFDYVALGHIHKPKIYEGERMAYAGSLEPTDINDCGERGMIVGEIKDDGAIDIKPIRMCKRQYVHLEVTLTPEWTKYMLCDKVEEMIREHGRENIYRIILRGQKSIDFDEDLTSVYRTGNVIDIEDKAVYTYDYDRLYEENEGNLMGNLIQTLRNRDEKALFYGVKALYMASNQTLE